MNQHIDISKLTTAERILLAEELWDSVMTSPESVPVRPDHIEELNRRLSAEKRGELSSLSWEEVKRQLYTDE